MRSRKNTRSKSHCLMVQNVPETSKMAVKVKIENKTSYRCIECDNTYPRRFNAERHYKRFHEVTQARRCCDEIFYTKSQYYDHKENVHNEKKKYGRTNLWKEENQSSDECNTAAINKDCTSSVSTSKTSIEIPMERDNVENLDSNNKEKYKNDARQQSTESPLKIFIYRLQEETNKNQNNPPLQSIENFTENSCKTLRKNALKNRVKVRSDDKENVIIYDCTATSVSNLMHLMSNTIDF